VSWFNTYESDGDGLTRRVVTHVDLSDMPIQWWTLHELGYRLAVIYPQVDGREHETASEAIKTEVRGLMAEIERRGYDPIHNLQVNERITGFGWLPWFGKKD
jgi:hypothetical protein